MTALRIAIAQLNVTVGDFANTIKKHVEAADIAVKNGADVIVFPELSITGYTPEDLLLRPDFLKAAEDALNEMIQKIKNIYCLVGHPQIKENKRYNTCTIFFNGKTLAEYHKCCLPNEGVFDEKRYFKPGEEVCIINIKNTPVGVLICEDIWHDNSIKAAVTKGAKVVIVPNASPFETNKYERRFKLLSRLATQHNVEIVYANLVGGQDELVFDGGSMSINKDGSLHHLLPFFQETLEVIDFNKKTSSHAFKNQIARIYEALCMGVRDYVNKNQIPGVLIGLSGGIDSALTLAIAVDALGEKRVHAVMMPSEFTSPDSKEDAEALAANLGVKYDVIPIHESYQSLKNTLKPFFNADISSLTFENMQARVRGIILMALSNATGKIVLNTGNRSELATGYCTLYGDMVGGFAVLKDVLKTKVYELAHYRNALSTIFPERILTREPTAELAHNQKDQDTLPPYSVLDQILELYLNQFKSRAEIIENGFDKEVVDDVIKRIHLNEYKRKQAPIGTHINNKSFGKDWRFPLTNKWR